MIQTRTFSFSDRSVEPTQPLLFCFSRSNSAAIAGGHADLSARSLVLSIIVRAMVPPKEWRSAKEYRHNIENLSGLGNSRNSRRTARFSNGEETPGARDRRLD